MRILSRLIVPLGALALASVFAACGGDDDEKDATPPTILSFTLSQDAIGIGGSVDLSWETKSAKQVIITDARGDAVPLGDAAAAQGTVTVTPAATTTYRLEARGPGGRTHSDHLMITVLPEPAPKIVSFSASPDLIAFEGTTTLSWEITDAASIAIEDGFGRPVNVDGAALDVGEVQVTVKVDSTFRLIATGRGGDRDVKEATVQIAAKPNVSLRAETSQIPYGGSTDLIWSATGATRVIVATEDGETLLNTGDSTSGAIFVQPDVATIYVITAEGTGGTVSAATAVHVIPKFESLVSLTEEAVRPGTEVEIAWVTLGAESVTISNQGGFTYETASAAEAANGSVSVPVSLAGSIIATARVGRVETSQRLTIPLSSNPAIHSFKVSPTLVGATPSDPWPVTLSWEIDGAARIVIEATPGGLLDTTEVSPRIGSLTVDVEETTSFKLTAYGTGSAKSESVVEVQAQ